MLWLCWYDFEIVVIWLLYLIEGGGKGGVGVVKGLEILIVGWRVGFGFFKENLSLIVFNVVKIVFIRNYCNEGKEILLWNRFLFLI